MAANLARSRRRDLDRPRVPQEPRLRYDRERGVRVPFGLGAPPGLAAANQCLACGFGQVPVTEEVIWTVPLPLTNDQIAATFGDNINLFNATGSMPGVASIDSTFLVNGILQTDLYCTGIGIHVFVEPLAVDWIGNGWTAPNSPTDPPPSADVWTENDLTNGALGGITTGITPATLQWGTDAQEAAWNFINAYQLQFRTNQRELMLNEQLNDVSYFASFGDFQAAGTSDVDVTQYAALANAQYRLQGSPTIFLPADYRRYGSATVTVGESNVNVGLFHPTNDFKLSPATRGGPKVQGLSCGSGAYLKIDKPCYFERGIPIGPQFVVNDPVHQARFQAALSIDDMTGSQNLLTDVNLGAVTATAATGPLEQTLDASPVNVAQSVAVPRQIYKGGIFKVAVKLKGWEMPGVWKAWALANMPQMFNGCTPQMPPSLPTPAQPVPVSPPTYT